MSKANSNDESDRESQHSQMSTNGKVSNDDVNSSISKRGVQKSPPSEPSLPRIRKPSSGSEKESRPQSSSSRSSQRSSQRASSVTGKAQKKEQTFTMPCINPEDRHHLESSF
ncbi:unnamed protein product [Allacma fusca]|uniref:Uncharacterized protein n=1 Tax=Allacma fusca TaxID=39272 RepID=A0A8J2NRD4_9HEXA|nr:unnamed protein product [Allacma fusca]